METRLTSVKNKKKLGMGSWSSKTKSIYFYIFIFYILYFIFIFFKKIYLRKNDLDSIKVVVCDVIECSVGVYHFILLKSSISIFYILSESSVY